MLMLVGDPERPELLNLTNWGFSQADQFVCASLLRRLAMARRRISLRCIVSYLNSPEWRRVNFVAPIGSGFRQWRIGEQA